MKARETNMMTDTQIQLNVEIISGGQVDGKDVQQEHNQFELYYDDPAVKDEYVNIAVVVVVPSRRINSYHPRSSGHAKSETWPMPSQQLDVCTRHI